MRLIKQKKIEKKSEGGRNFAKVTTKVSDGLIYLLLI